MQHLIVVVSKCFHGGVLIFTVCQYLLHDQGDSHVVWDKLADGNSEGVSTWPEGNSGIKQSNSQTLLLHTP